MFAWHLNRGQAQRGRLSEGFAAHAPLTFPLRRIGRDHIAGKAGGAIQQFGGGQAGGGG